MTNRIEFLGKQYPVNFSPYVLEKINEKWGSLKGMLSALTESDDLVGKLDGTLFLTHCLLTAGNAYAALLGESDLPPVPPLETLRIAIPLSELKAVQSAAFIAMDVAAKTSIETESNSKNPTATLGH